MRFLLTLLILALSSPLIHAADGDIGDACCYSNLCPTQKPCREGLSCCLKRPLWMEDIGGVCYDPKVSTCSECPVANPIHAETSVCPIASPTCCGSACLDSQSQCCHHYGNYNYFICGSDTTCCGFDNGKSACCRNSDQLCMNDVCVPKPICPQGTQPCGTSCYQPKDYVCADPSHSKLCPTAFPKLCGGDACYSESQYTCDINGQLQPVGATTGPTREPTTPPTTGPTSSTPAPGCVLPGDLKCGNRCYSPTTHVCADNGSSFLCPLAFPSKCGEACYSSTQYKCVNGQLQPL